MLENAYLLAKIGADTAENERNFAENLPKIWQNLVDLRQPLLRIDDHGLLRLLLGHGRDDLIEFFIT